MNPYMPKYSPMSSLITQILIALSLLLLLPLLSHDLPKAVIATSVSELAEVNGLFVFGSSLVDNGNNNFLKNSTARADYMPYGVDFPLGPSGRFSNGKNSIDVLGELLKLNHKPRFIPPFADPKTKGSTIVHGVNYASGGSGILDETGSSTGEVMSMNQQIRHFETATLPDLRALLPVGRDPRLFKHHISKYLFVVGTGGNDYLLNYFVHGENKRTTLQKFTNTLICNLSLQLKKLYDLGARKFVLFSIQPMGCTPVATAHLQASNGSCIEALNEAAILFNSHLKSIVAVNTKKPMPGSAIVVIDSYNIIRDIIDNPLPHGFSDTKRPCCQLPSNEGNGGGILCQRKGRACSDRTGHVFFDGLHPTEAVNVEIAHKAYGSASKAAVYPINVKQLASL